MTPDGVRPGALLIQGEKIRAVVSIAEVPAGAQVEDIGSAAILPGLVDSHVHINEPGRTEWEGFETATRAAAAGGYTMLVDMPLNCLPPTTTVDALERKRAAARSKCYVDWAAWGGVVSNNQADIGPLADAGALGFKCFLIHPGIDGFTSVSEQELRAALPHVAQAGLPLLVHAELPGPVERANSQLANANWKVYETYLQSRPDEAELSAIRLLIALCREYHFPLHVVHLSTADGLELIRSAKMEGLPVTVETCPHYLHFAAEEIADGSVLCKCAPPIRSRENRERLWQGLREGIIDLVATDHSPCPLKMKEGDFQTAWGGITGLSVALPVMWTEAGRRGFSLVDLARWMAEAPAKLAGCDSRKGQLAAGYDADFVLFDPEGEFQLNAEQLCQRHAISPYVGKKFRGVVKATYLRGQPVFESSSFANAPRGREFERYRTPEFQRVHNTVRTKCL